MIVEGVVTSQNSDGTMNVAPMGPVVEGDFESLIFRPFQTSTTCHNLKATRCGVFHVIDSVELLAQAAVGKLKELPAAHPAAIVDGCILMNCCRWFEFRVVDCDMSSPRTVMQTEIVARGERRPFLGFNRARHAVLEAAILATRVHLLPENEIKTQLSVLNSAVEKTGGVAESDAFAMLVDHINASY